MDFNIQAYVLDLETNIKNKSVGKFLASPFHKQNKIVVAVCANTGNSTGRTATPY